MLAASFRALVLTHHTKHLEEAMRNLMDEPFHLFLFISFFHASQLGPYELRKHR